MIQPAFASTELDKACALAHRKKLDQEPPWHRLLHYGRNLSGRYQSEIDDPSFFLAPDGRRNPRAELDATLKAFFEPNPEDPYKQSWQCRFPARYAWLKDELNFTPAHPQEAFCARYENWKAQMDPGGLSLVFASYYMNNPASTYGHTFLRLNSKKHGASERLLDYVVNYAADLESDNGLLFAVKGLMGGYHGRFSTFPYYMKVQEYNNLESRDLWEYDLNVSPPDLERLLKHLWEIGTARSRYFFFNKNCSYYLLPVLDVMDPSQSFKSPFVLRAIPIDTLKHVIQQPGMLKGVTYRPSHATKMLEARKRLSRDERLMAEKTAKNPKSITPEELALFTPERQAVVLDSAYDLFRYRVGFHRDQPPSVQEKESALLLLRNRVGVTSPTLDFSSTTVTAPHLGHKSLRATVGYGFSNRSHFEEYGLRSALHSQDDPPAGYLPGSQLEMLNFRLRYDLDRDSFYVQELALVDLVSLTPWDRWVHPLSWKMKTGLGVADDLNRDPDHSLYYGLTLGSGYAAKMNENLILFGMAEAVTQLGNAYSHTVRFGGGPEGGILWIPSQRWHARFVVSQDFYAVGGTPSTTKMGLHQSLSLVKNFDLRAKLERQNTYKEVLLSLVLFL